MQKARKAFSGFAEVAKRFIPSYIRRFHRPRRVYDMRANRFYQQYRLRINESKARSSPPRK